MSLLAKQKQIQESLWLLVGKNREEGRVREPGMDMDTLLHLTWRTSKGLLDSTGDSAQCLILTHNGKEYEKRMQICMLV